MIADRAHNILRAPRRPSHPRGIALLLVMVALGVGGAATTFYLAARDNSVAIGENARLAAASEWASQSGAELAVAMMQTNVAWRSAAGAGGTLLDGVALSGANVSVILTDLNGNPPDASDLDVVITAVASVSGVSALTQRVVNIRPSATPEQAIDPELGEFALYAKDELCMEPHSALGVWPLSPMAKLGRPVKIGAGFTGVEGAVIDPAANLVDAQLFVCDDASSGLISEIACGGFVGGAALPLTVPAIPAAVPAAFSTLPVASAGDLDLQGPSQSRTLSAGRHGNVECESGVIVTLDAANGQDYSFDNARLRDRSTLLIKGDVRLEVRGELRIEEGSSLELSDDSSSVMLYLGGDMIVRDAGVGMPRSLARDSSRTRQSVTAWTDPSRIRVLGTTTSGRVSLDDSSLAAMSVHAPRAEVRILHGSTIFGRATARSIRVDPNSAVLYDPSLDNRVGFTTRDGPLYQDDGSPLPGLVDGINSFNPSQGCQALPSFLDASILAASLGLIGDIIVNPFGSDPRAGGTGAGLPSLRKAERAAARPWPLRAHALERACSPGQTRIYAGAFVPPNSTTVDFDAQAHGEDSLTNPGDTSHFHVVFTPL